MSRIQEAFFNVSSMFARFVAVILLCSVLVPPVAAAVSVTTLLNAPLPGGELPAERPQIVAEASTVLAANGEEIGLFRGFDQTVEIAPEDIPQVMKDAIVAIEDRRFYEHNGVDIEGIGRAAQANAEAGGVAQGGSTITQQYVKNVYLSGERTVERKVREALLATELEKTMSKEEILFEYLETVYFGSGAYGVGAAAKVYFGVEVADLGISQAALLAGLVQAPTRLSPRKNPDLAQDRRVLVLEAMRNEGYITGVEYKIEAARQLWLDDVEAAPESSLIIAKPQPKGASRYPYFVDWIERELIATLGEQAVYNDGLTIETTIEPELQAAAEQSVAGRLENTEAPVDMSLVSVDPATGHVVAMVGGRDYGNSQVNLAIGGSLGMQPGSAFKPFVLARAMSLGIDPETVYQAPAKWRVPNCTGDQCYLQNYSGGGGGSMTLRNATRVSMNTVFTQLLVDVGIPETVALARQLGLKRLDPNGNYGPSLALGAAETSPLEMASAYGTFANRGVHQDATGIKRVIDGEGNVIIDNTNPQGERVLETVVADNMTDVLVGVVSGGTGKAAAIGRPLAGKTGTAQAYRAAWFVGYTPDIATAVWMGHADSPASLRNVNGVGSVTGGSHPARAFRDYMKVAVEGTEIRQFPEPGKIVANELGYGNDAVDALRRKKTVARDRQAIAELGADCNGQPCLRNGPAKRVESPAASPSESPSASSSTTNPPTTRRSTTPDSGATATSGPTLPTVPSLPESGRE